MPATVRYRCPVATRKLDGSFAGLGLDRGNRDGVDDIFGLAAAGEIVCRPIEPLQNRADRSCASEPLSQFVSNVSRLKIGKDQNIRATADWRGWGLGFCNCGH